MEGHIKTIGQTILVRWGRALYARSTRLFLRALELAHHHVGTPGLDQKMKHPANSYEDLAFLIKKNMQPGDPKPPKFLAFFNSRAEAQAGAEYLRSRSCLELRDKIKWFHSGMTDQFRKEEMHALLVGDVYGHAATDAAGMVSTFSISGVPELIVSYFTGD